MSSNAKSAAELAPMQEAFERIVAAVTDAIGGAALRVPMTHGHWGSLLTAGSVSDRRHVHSFVLERGGLVAGTLDLHLRQGRSLGEGLGRVASQLSMLTKALIEEERGDAEDAHRALKARLERARVAWHLTPRQLAVLEALSTGTANKLIALALSCSEKTIEAHLAELRRRSGAANRAELVARFWTEL